MGFKRCGLELFVAAILLLNQITANIHKRNTEDEESSREAIHFMPILKEFAAEEGFHIINNMNISLQKKLNEIKNREEFVKFFGIDQKIKVRTGSTAVEAVNAGCTPLLTPVPLSLPSTPTDTYFPSCVLLERCGGCCFGDILTCQPSQTETVKLKVTKISSMPNGATRSRRETTDTEIVVTEQRHLKCACQCATMEDDCVPEIQKYDANECACKCIDRNSENACLQNTNSHFWDQHKCSCFCRKVLECSSGEKFDHTDCRCKFSLDGGRLRTVDFNSING